MLKKTLLIIFSILLFGIIILLIMLPGMLINYVENNDQELIGREVEIEEIDINYFGGGLTISDFKVFDAQHDSIFFYFKEMKMNLAISELFAKKLHIESFQLNKWYVRIKQKGNQFNFDDIIEKLNESQASAETDKTAAESAFVIENVEVNAGTIDYSSILYPLVSLDSISFELPFFSDSSTSVQFKSQLKPSTGGKLAVNGSLDLVDSLFYVKLEALDLGLAIVEPYLRPVINFKELKGLYNSSMLLNGSLVNSNELNFSGGMSVSNFEFIDSREKKILSNDEFEFVIDTVQFSEAVYNIDKISSSGLTVDFELYQGGNTFSDLTAVDSLERNTTGYSDEEVTEYENPFLMLFKHVKNIVKSYDESAYRLNLFKVEDVRIQLTDYTLQTRQFNYAIHDAGLKAEGLTSSDQRLPVNFEAKLNEKGKVEGYVRPFTQNPKDLDLSTMIQGLDLTPFSPYTIDYVDFPLENGTMAYECEVKIRDRKLESMNIIEIDQLNWGDRSKLEAENEKLPVKLGTSLLKDLEGQIYLDIPIEGDLDDPNFKLRKVVWRVITNLLTKAVTFPFKTMGEIFDFTPSDLESISFKFLQQRLFKNNKKQLDQLARILKHKPDLKVDFKRSTKNYYELQEYALNEMKYRYLFDTDTIPDVEGFSREVYQQMLELDKNDSAFTAFVFERSVLKKGEVSVEKACIEAVGEEKASSQVDRIGNKRQQAIKAYLIQEKGIDPSRISFSVMPPDSLKSNVSAHEFKLDFWLD